MADSNNAPGWKENPEISGAGMPANSYGSAGNGRGVQQNALPKGARTASPSDNAPTTNAASLSGNGFGNYDPRYSGSQDRMTDHQGGNFGSADDAGTRSDPKAGDRATAYQHTNPPTRSNPLVAEKAADLTNPHRGAMKKEWSN